MKKPTIQLASLMLLTVLVTSLALPSKTIEAIQVTSEKYIDVSGFDHMEVEVQNDFTCSKDGVRWSLFGDLPVTEVLWNLDSESRGQIKYLIDDHEMQGEVLVNLNTNEIKLKLQIREYGLVHWLLTIEEVDLEVQENNPSE